MEQTDVAVIGGGIVGLATAYQLTRLFPGLGVTVLEKEDALAEHQTGRNSGVLHTGIYYKPGSLKALNCRAGKQAMEAFCAAEALPYEICGKVIVAVEAWELPILQGILERGLANGVNCRLIGPEALAEIEPHTPGLQAIHVPEAGIVDYRAVCERLALRIREAGGRIHLGARVLGVRTGPPLVLETGAGAVACRQAVNCAGLHSDRMAALAGAEPPAQIVPFRGEYYALREAARPLCRNLIYPVPDPAFPFLGVHFTRMTTGEVECGPNAVLAFGREAYTRRQVHLPDLWETLAYPGFRRLAARYWRTGLGEMWRSVSKAAFVRALQRLVPEIREAHLEPAPAGIRAQAVAPEGAMVDDFLIQETPHMIHVCNAPSPAATAALNIGLLLAESLRPRLSA